MKHTIIIAVSAIATLSSVCWAGKCQTPRSLCAKRSVCPKASQAVPPAEGVEYDDPNDVLAKLQEQNSQLKSYEAKIEYLFIQDPELLESRTLRTGNLYYKKNKDRSTLRINFETLKQDDAKEEKHREHFIFDGVWLTKIDYQLENVEYTQLAEETKPKDVFKFIGDNFPMVGFTEIQNLRREFEITLIPQQGPEANIHLNLRVKKDSIHKDKYTNIDFWIDKRTFLPAGFVATSTEDDIYDIKLRDIKVNKILENRVFRVETPKHFSENRTVLK